MSHSQSARGRYDQSPPESKLLSRPLEFLSEDHLRARQVCVLITSMISDTGCDRQGASQVLRFLNEEWNVHFSDETEDLFPMLVQRCDDEDSIEAAIARIRIDQDQASLLVPAIRQILTRYLDAGSAPTQHEQQTLNRFATHLRRHIAAENAILLPIAHARLTQADLRTLSKHMRSRRGLPVLPETTIVE
jgi:hemerythrin-like domain-containing protein|tara:strand:+ start:57 stop:626 length:570 start_codon:yes stop_codon:yes gene_type:complete